jgi:ribonuclease G
MEINTAETCPSCNGSGKISSSLLIDESIERQLAYYVKEKGHKALTIKVNPIVAAYLTKGLTSIRFKLALKYKCSLKIKESSENHLLQVIWFDSKNEKIEN